MCSEPCPQHFTHLDHETGCISACNTQHGKGVGQVDLVDAQSAPRAAVQPPGEAWVRQEAGRRGAQHVRLEHRSRRRDDTGGWNFLKMISTNELSSI